MFEKNGNSLTMQFVIHKTPTKILTIFGTRPGAIKLAPVILKARRDNSFDVRICVTGQHDEMLKQVLDFFGIIPDHDLEIMQPNQSLYDVTADILKTLADVIVS